jgi:hypothetical protein
LAPADLNLLAISASGAAAPNQTRVIWYSLKIDAARLFIRGVGRSTFARSLITITPNLSINC